MRQAGGLYPPGQVGELRAMPVSRPRHGEATGIDVAAAMGQKIRQQRLHAGAPGIEETRHFFDAHISAIELRERQAGVGTPDIASENFHWPRRLSDAGIAAAPGRRTTTLPGPLVSASCSAE